MENNLPLNYDYLPCPPNLKIAESIIHGFGIFATEDIPILTDLGLTHMKTKKGCLRINYGGFINHSIQPNASIVKIGKGNEYHLITKYNIQKGEEITVDYCVSICGCSEK